MSTLDLLGLSDDWLGQSEDWLSCQDGWFGGDPQQQLVVGDLGDALMVPADGSITSSYLYNCAQATDGNYSGIQIPGVAYFAPQGQGVVDGSSDLAPPNALVDGNTNMSFWDVQEAPLLNLSPKTVHASSVMPVGRNSSRSISPEKRGYEGSKLHKVTVSHASTIKKTSNSGRSRCRNSKPADGVASARSVAAGPGTEVELLRKKVRQLQAQAKVSRLEGLVLKNALKTLLKAREAGPGLQ